jgi:hypothetical protein
MARRIKAKIRTSDLVAVFLGAVLAIGSSALSGPSEVQADAPSPAHAARDAAPTPTKGPA